MHTGRRYQSVSKRFKAISQHTSALLTRVNPEPGRVAALLMVAHLPQGKPAVLADFHVFIIDSYQPLIAIVAPCIRDGLKWGSAGKLKDLHGARDLVVGRSSAAALSAWWHLATAYVCTLFSTP